MEFEILHSICVETMLKRIVAHESTRKFTIKDFHTYLVRILYKII